MTRASSRSMVGANFETPFESLYIPEPNSGCWLWDASTTRGGYGQYWRGRERWRAHRLSFWIYVGDIPPGKLVCHRCDVPSCVNPDHLWIGSDRDNVLDTIRKGRRVVRVSGGEKHNWSKLTARDVVAIRADPRTTGEIARAFGVSLGNIRAIKSREIWASIPPSPSDVDAGLVTKLSAEIADAIRADKRPARVIAEQFGVGKSMIDKIRQNRSWVKR